MKITLLCSDARHPVNAYLEKWMSKNGTHHTIELVRNKAEALGGDILFLVSCSEIITSQDRSAYGVTLVLHASDLPKGRGWSPHIWEILHGAEQITLTLLEAEDRVDSGKIWKKLPIQIPKHALWDEINHSLFEAEIGMIEFAVEHFGTIEPVAQSADVEITHYPRRAPRDSQIDPTKNIAEQFDLIRICDPDRFPAYFEYLGHRYILKLEKSNEQ